MTLTNDKLRAQISSLISEGERPISLEETVSRQSNFVPRRRLSLSGKVLLCLAVLVAAGTSAALLTVSIKRPSSPQSLGKGRPPVGHSHTPGTIYHVPWVGLGHHPYAPEVVGGNLVQPAALLEPCSPAVVSGAATLTTADFGAVSFYALANSAFCSMTWSSPIAVSLIQASGKAAPVVSSAPNPDLINAPGPAPNEESYVGSTLPTLAQEERDHNATQLGFKWSGQYCGPPIAAVRVTYRIWHNGELRNYTYQASMAGGVPACSHPGGPNGSVAFGYMSTQPSAPAYPIPSNWSLLQAALILPATSSPSGFSYQVSLTNPTSLPISLSPCPGYVVTVRDLFEVPGGEANGAPITTARRNMNNIGSLNCSSGPTVINPGASVVFSLQFSATAATINAGTTMASSSSTKVTWAMPGIQTLSKSLAIMS